METVLVVGSTGNIGVAAVIGALNAGRKVLAVVRNASSANKLFEGVGTKEGIITVEADVLSDNAVQNVVNQVKAGKLPHFQHVYSTVGGGYIPTPLTEISTQTLRQIMTQNFESNFFAYRATVPYLLEQNHPSSTWTICTGSQGDIAIRAAPAMSQGPLFSMANAACRDLLESNVRFNEVYLGLRVEVDSSAAISGAMKSSEFAKNYQKLLDSPEIRSCRVVVTNPHQVEDLDFKRKHSF